MPISTNRRSARFDRLAAGVVALRTRALERQRFAVDRRNALREKKMIGAIIRDAAVGAGIDLAKIEALRSCDEASAKLAALGDNAELERADAAWNEAHGRPEANPLARLATRLGGLSDMTVVPSEFAAADLWLAWVQSGARRGAVAPQHGR